eukprot:12513-Heterococcus_DN1.PRE.2
MRAALTLKRAAAASLRRADQPLVCACSSTAAALLYQAAALRKQWLSIVGVSSSLSLGKHPGASAIVHSTLVL